MSSSFIGKPWFKKEYKDAHPELFFQHRGKGRWYQVADQKSTVPPPQRPHIKKPTTVKTEAAVKTKDGEPRETRPERKRRPVGDLDNQPELKKGRTRQGSTLDVAIDVDKQAAQQSDDSPNGSAQKQSSGDDADDISDEIPVAPAKGKDPLTLKGKGNTKARPPKKKKTKAVPKPLAPRNGNGMRTYYPPENVKPQDAIDDMILMGSSRLFPSHHRL